MTTFDGWDARALGCGPTGGHSRNGTGGAQMLIHGQDTQGWVMTYGSELQHGSTFGRGHYRGDYSADTLYGSRGYVLRSELAMAGPDTLAHFRTKGSKNGVRRYQQPDGTWTPLGLRERRIREGFGERRAARKEARAKRREEKAAAKAAERSRRAEELAKFKDRQRASNPKTMTDEELRKGIERKKLEQEYRELNEGAVIKLGKAIVSKYADYKVSKMKSDMQKEERKYQYAKLQAEQFMAQQRSKADIARAEADSKKAQADILDIEKGGRLQSNQAKLVGAKLAYRNTTIRGGIGNFFNKKLSGAGQKKSRREQYAHEEEMERIKLEQEREKAKKGSK